jgi:DNA-binding MarR family transcriptional regulator
VTGIVDRLVEHGLVVREEDPRDRRIVYGRPTTDGLALIDRLVLATREQLAGLLATLSDEDLATICGADHALVAATRRLCGVATERPDSSFTADWAIRRRNPEA